MEKELQKAYLIGIDLGDTFETEISMSELKELVKTAGGEVFDCIIQKRDSVDPKICIGSGKLLEIKSIMEENNVKLAIFDRELAPAQINNISKLLDCPVIDRTIVILDIFAQNAKTKEGQLQVELAQLKHRYNNLKGQGTELSRLGGGIGTRGPGETKLETDKRHIRRRLAKLQENLEDLKKQRTEIRKNRLAKDFKTVSIVGYTNAGKSTLLNALTDSNVLVKDQLFATLDTTSRELKLIGNNSAILIDTVGFIRNLPHFLIDAFKATLEEVVLSDLVLLVIDSSDPNHYDHKKITLQILDELGYKNKIITVYNKCDKTTNRNSDGINVSAITKEGFPELIKKIDEELFPPKIKVTLSIPYEKSQIVYKLRNKYQILSEKYTDNYGIFEILIDYSDLPLYNEYIQTNI